MQKWNIGDTVVHGRDGVCVIEDITEMTVADGSRPYYVLSPVYDKGGRIYVPADRDTGAVMRAPLSKDEINSLIDSIPDQDNAWIDNEKLRQKEYSKVICEGDNADLIGVISALFEKRTEKEHAGRKFHAADERMLSEAQKILHGEFAYVLGISPEDVPGYIHTRLHADSHS